MWPLHATFQAMWIKSTLPGGTSLITHIIKFPYAASGAGFGVAFYALLAALRAFNAQALLSGIRRYDG